MSQPTASGPWEYPWGEGTEPGGGVVALGTASLLTVVVLNLWLVGELGLFFDLCFVLVCVGLAVLVRREAFFVVGVLPPLMMLGVFVVVALSAPDSIAQRDDGVVQAVVSGLAHHAAALVAGYAACLLVLAWRRRSPAR